MSYDKELKISLWKSDGTNAKAPILKGKATINGTEYDVALWKNDSDNPRAPTLNGKLQLPQDRHKSNQPAFKAELPKQEDRKEEIPL